MVPSRYTSHIQVNNCYLDMRIFLCNNRHCWSAYIAGSYTSDVFYWFHLFIAFMQIWFYLNMKQKITNQQISKFPNFQISKLIHCYLFISLAATTLRNPLLEKRWSLLL